MGRWMKLGMWVGVIALELLSLMLLIATGGPAAEQCRGGAALPLSQSGQLGTQRGLAPLLLGLGWPSSSAGSGARGGGSARPALALCPGNGCGWPWGRQTGLWEGAMPGRSTLPSWQGGSHCRRQGTTVTLHPVPLCPGPARRDVALPGCVCHLLWLQGLGVGDRTTECSQGEGADGTESFPAWRPTWGHWWVLYCCSLRFEGPNLPLPCTLQCNSQGPGRRFLPCRFKPENPSLQAP